MKALALIFAALLLAASSQAQEKRNSIYLEAGGNAVLYSVNYDRIFDLSNKLKLAPRIGFMYLPLSDIARTDFGDLRIPLELNFLWSKNPNARHFLEGGAGMSFIQIKEQKINAQTGVKTTVGNRFGNVTTLRIGYRYQRPTGGFMLRAGLLVPIIQDEFSKSTMGDDVFYTIFPGVSFGYTF